MKLNKIVTLCGLALVLAAQSASAFSSWVSRVPNGNVLSCAVCHDQTPSLNSFGDAFVANGNTWNATLAAKDSDGDGATNGQELGDPNGTGTPTPGAQVTNPGDPASKPVTATAPSITAQPVSRTVTAGASVSFSVTASGTAPLSYQWMKNGANISGATAATYTIAATTTANAGSYSVRVSNSAGSVTSSAATLTVNAAVVAPTITAQPVSRTVTAGASVSFSVTASGTAPLSYQWMKNGANITGATAATYTITATTTADAGSYSVRVSNSAGSVTSAAATLTVNAAVVAPTITAQPVSRTVIAGASASFSVTASGTAPLSYQWMKNGANISGATAATYTIAATTTANAGSYSVRVSNSAGSVTSAAATLTVNAATSAPTITMQPISQTVTAGANVTFMVGASGTAPLSYQWKKNGVNISGATSASLVLTSVSTANVGSYTVTVSNSAGSVTSTAATLTVNPAPVVLSIALTSPTNNETFLAPANVDLEVAVSPATDILNVAYFHGTNLLGTVTTAPFSMTASNLLAGKHVLSAKVTDNRGESKLSEPVTINVITTPPPSTNPGPVVRIIAPRDGSTFAAPARLMLAAQATDSNGTIAKVEFFSGNTRLGTATPFRTSDDDDDDDEDDDDDGDDDDEDDDNEGRRTSTLYFLVLNRMPAGYYTITAKATDNLGATTTSAPIRVTVKRSYYYGDRDRD